MKKLYMLLSVLVVMIGLSCECLGYRWPVDGDPQSWQYGYSFAEAVGGRRHLGVDIIKSPLAPIKAPSDCKVVVSKLDQGTKDNPLDGYGYYLVCTYKTPSGEERVFGIGHTSRRSEYEAKGVGEYTEGTILAYVGYDDENGLGGPHVHWFDYGEPYSAIRYPGYTSSSYDADVDYDQDGTYIGGKFTDPIKQWAKYIDVGNHPIGHYSDGFHTDGTSQAFVQTYNRHYNKIGWPADHGGGLYVHSWASTLYPSYSVWVQDFQGNMAAEHFGTDGQSAIILSDYLPQKMAFLVKEGFWGYYKENDGQHELGAPFTEEITNLKYATNKQPYQAGDAVRAGDSITVQKFYRVYSDQRKTLVYSERLGRVFLFAVGEFSLGTDFGLEGEQVYIYVDTDPANDIPWPNSTQKVPTGKWFTKPGDYTFVRHVNGQRVGALSVHISEGNHQFVDSTITTPENLTATAETSDSIRLALTLPGGLPGYNIRVYQDGTKIADQAAAESYLVNGLNPNTSYCFRVSAVDNTSGVESALSGEACATTPGQNYAVNRTVTCLGVNPDSPNDPLGETTVFYNSNNFAYSWIELGNVYGEHNIKWRWYDPHGNRIYVNSLNTIDPVSQGYLFWPKYKVWREADIAINDNYGIWRVEIYVDDNLAATDSFSLSPIISQPDYIVNWTALCRGADPDSPYDPANRTTVFYNSNSFVHAWIELGKVYGDHNIVWRWFAPDGSLHGEGSAQAVNPDGAGYRARGLLGLSYLEGYGVWRVETYIDDNLAATDSFSLAPPVITFSIKISGSNLRVSLRGTKNIRYTVQTATNILGPWTDHMTVDGRTNGSNAFIVPNTLPARFFR